MTRLKWTKYKSFYASEFIICGNDIYWSLIYTPHNFVEIYDGRHRAIAGYKYKNIKSAKAWVKKELVKLGMVVYDEVRLKRR